MLWFLPSKKVVIHNVHPQGLLQLVVVGYNAFAGLTECLNSAAQVATRAAMVHTHTVEIHVVYAIAVDLHACTTRPIHPLYFAL